jgi:hypothetical protein
MSRLVLKGDLIKNFGEYYPVPYIEEVLLGNSGATPGRIQVITDYSFLFLAPEVESAVPGSDTEVLLAAIENLNFYFLITKTIGQDEPFDGRAFALEHNAAAISAYALATNSPSSEIPGVEDPLDELSLLLYDSSLLVEFMKNATPYSFAGAPIGFDLVEIDSALIYEKIRNKEFAELYDAQGRRIIKVIGQEIFNVQAASGFAASIGDLPETFGMNLLAFSSLLSQKEFEASSHTTNAALSTYVGDVAYERILENNRVPNQTEISFFDANGDIAMEPPLQATNRKYYKTSAANRTLIISKFNEVLDAYEPLVESGGTMDDALRVSIDSIKYALQVYADQVELLTRVNAARRAFVEKSSGTTTGALFGDLKRLIRTANREIKTFPQLTKRLTVNSKIIDIRKTVLSGYSLPTPAPITDFSEVINLRYGRSVVTSEDRTVNIADKINFAEGTIWDENDDSGFNVRKNKATGTIEVTGDMGTEEVEVTVDLTDPIYDNLNNDDFYVSKEYNVSFGYALFDYRQLLIKNSYLAELVDVEKFLSTFGMEYTQGFFQLIHTEMAKWEPVYEDRLDGSAETFEDISEETISYMTFFTDPDHQYSPDTPYRSPEANRRNGSAAANNVNNFPEKIITNNGTIINQYIAQRNLEFATAETEDALDYRMVAIEFQNIDLKSTLLNWDRKVTDQYRLIFRLNDYTKQAMQGVIGQYIMAKTAFSQYLLEAEEACSYNNIDGVFNDFFIRAQTQRYAATPSMAPWVYAAVTYIKHLDFLMNVYGGDKTQMLLAAKQIVQNISPQAGTLSHVRAFAAKMEGMYDELYSASSPIGVKMGGGDSDGNGIPDMFEPEVRAIDAKRTIAATIESTFIEDDRNEFLSAINAELERYEAAQDAFENAYKAAKKAARQAEKERQREELIEQELQAKVDYEYERIRFKYDNGCYYAVQRTVGTADEIGWWWVSPYYVDEFAEPYARTHNGYQLGEPSSYSYRQRDIDKVEGTKKCRSRRRTGSEDFWNYLGDSDGDWNDESTGRHGDPYNEIELKKKIRNSIK